MVTAGLTVIAANASAASAKYSSTATLANDISAPASTVNRTGAADYLIKQLVGGTHLEFAGGYGPDFGGTADVAIALAAEGHHDTALQQVLTYLAAHVADYADPAGAASFPGPFGGALGKLAVLAEITGQDPDNFGGFDLLKSLTDHVCTAADTTGGCTAAGDFYQAFSSISQSLGVLALARAGQTVPASAATRLESLQCPDGGFSSELITTGKTCTSDVDTTGFAVQALALLPSAGDAMGRAVNFLRAGQQPDGGWTGTAGENSNSTALAVQGLLAATASADSSDPAVTAAITFLASRQNSDGGFGISAAAPGSDVLATRQVLPAVAFATLTTLQHAVDLAPGGPTSSAPPSSSGSSNTSPSSTSKAPTGSIPAVGQLANTGARTSGAVSLAVWLLLSGVVLIALAGVRRPAGARVGRHSRRGKHR